MKIKRNETQSDWSALLQKLNSELTDLSRADRAWLVDRINAIDAVQASLDKLFRQAGGLDACAVCDGACCRCGKHHLTLTNLIAYLLAGESPPVPALERTCPFLGETGCSLPVGKRPYNCITFFCETLDDRLDDADRKRLMALDRQLREEYQLVEQRYPAATLRGIWIALARFGDGQLLQRNEQEVVE